jgi:Large polyvalent protein-associated domain 3
MTEDQIKELRDKAYQWAKENLVGQIVQHDAIEAAIEINNKGVKHTLKGKNLTNTEETEKNLAVIRSTYSLRQLIVESQYTDFEEDKSQRDNINGVHILEKEFEGHTIKIVIRATRDKTYFYDHSVKK